MAEGFFCIFCSLERREKERKIAQCSALSDKIVSRGTLSEKVLFQVQETIFTARIYRYMHRIRLPASEASSYVIRQLGSGNPLDYGVLSKSAL
ncbi:hypothetical protein ET33_06730 [Paenibacillus tyrfis]|uniref:Uncharacterized protein n=1 Tax=Paenibacillus tyrfis TaxID=1501230 RepID=A0A081P245_9BACL|nr:hypothetical protein ET33_06730 [Paenibacillus tyrfis]